MSRVNAQHNLAKDISSFKFVVSLVVRYDIQFEINITSQQIQKKEFEIHHATSQLAEMKKFLVDHRNNTELKKTLVNAAKLAEEFRNTGTL